MVDIKEIDRFIKYCGNMYLKNPNIPISDMTIYTGLSSYGVNNSKDVSLVNELNNLEKFFKNSNNLFVYVNEKQPNFLQFKSKKDSNKSEDIKIYYTTSKENIEFAAKEIFGFINQNNMETNSIVSNKLRSDSIVIRLSNEEDARKVIFFINNNKKLKEISKETNPFLLKEGVVSLAYDNLISYNKVLSVILKDYFEDLKAKKSLDKACREDFNIFLRNYYMNLYRNCSKITDVYKNPHYLKCKINGRFKSDGEAINNFEQVTRLIMNVLEGNMSLEGYFKFYNECVNINKDGSFINYYEETYKRKKDALNNHEESMDINMVNLLNNYINYSYNKYGSIELVEAYINKYIEGNINAITRDNNFRSKFVNHMLTPKIILKITNNNLKSYIENVIPINIRQDNMYNIKQKNFK